jgi:hypothetical protein
MAGRDNVDHHKSGLPNLWKRRSPRVGHIQLAPTRKRQVGGFRLVETPAGERRESATWFHGGACDKRELLASTEDASNGRIARASRQALK